MKTSDTPLSEQAANEMTHMITVERRFRPGDKLPNELELSQELGISRITLREAVRILCTRGLLEIRRGRGTFVTSGRESAIVIPSGDAEPDITLRDALETRLALEPAAVYYAVRRATEEELRTLDEQSAGPENALSRGPGTFFRQTEEFYNAFAQVARNPVITPVLALVNHALYGEKGLGTDPDFIKTTAPGIARACRELSGYLRTRNAEGARAVDRAHIIRLFHAVGLEIE